ncbi:MAG: autotransporter outer membrane beta-barrel domain-containing protein [Gammaproteobacteria bacterium]
MKITPHLFRYGLAAVLLGLAGLAAASPSEEEQICDRENFAGCLNGVGSSVSNGAALRMNSADFGDLASERSGRKSEDAQAALYSTSVGLPAGDGMGGSVFGLWASYSYSDFDSDFAFQGTSLAYDADAHNVLVGFDRLLWDRLLLGLSLGYQWVGVDSDFNGGELDSDGYVIAPYAAVILNDIFSVDFSGGIAQVDYDQDRISPVDGTDIDADFDGDRWFFATNLNALYVYGNFVLGARVGYLRTDEHQDAYLETGSTASANAGVLRTVTKRKIDLSQLAFGGEVAYAFDSLEPYFMATYVEDLSRDDGNNAGGLPGNFTSVQPGDDDEVQLNFGLRYYTEWGLTTTFEYQRVEGRKDFDSDTFMLVLRAAL